MKLFNSKQKSTLAKIAGGIALVAVSGCATYSGAENKENLSKLKYGMSESQVLNLLGTPETVVKESSTDDKWIYEFRTEDKSGRNMFVSFHDGDLIKTGEMSGREVAAESPQGTSGSCTHRPRPEMMQEALCIK